MINVVHVISDIIDIFGSRRKTYSKVVEKFTMNARSEVGNLSFLQYFSTEIVDKCREAQRIRKY